LDRLRHVKNVAIVGYSMPPTDIYLQYFLKTALGPNKDFDKITVFNPVLFQRNNDAEEMMKRYAVSFSEQIRRRIDYRPALFSRRGDADGTFAHFVRAINGPTNSIFF